jgi:hypothetical protein
MSLLRKMRVLVGALVHKPFTPRPEKVDLSEDPALSPQKTAPHISPDLTERQPGVTDTERVADLIAEQKREE